MEKSNSTETGRASTEKWSPAGKGKIERECSKGNQQGTGQEKRPAEEIRTQHNGGAVAGEDWAGEHGVAAGLREKTEKSKP
jgi:hypothetical protein